MHLLVVDDDSPSRHLLETVFSARGHRVDSASDGVEALEVARKNPPDMILTDILMPRMDGYRLCIEWQNDPRLAKSAFAFYTATYVEEADESFALTLGADAFLRKSTDAAALVHAVEQIERERRAQRRGPRRKPADEIVILREYNERLVTKLEKKVGELEIANADLRVALELMTDQVDAKDIVIRHLSEELAKQASQPPVSDYSR